MKLINQQLPFVTIWMVSNLTVVCLFLANSAFASSAASCHSIYYANFKSQFDVGSNRRAYHSYIDRNGNQSPEAIVMINSLGQKINIPTPNFLKEYLSPHKQLNIASMGVLGDIFDLITKPSSAEPELHINDWRYREVKKDTENLLKLAPVVIPLRILDLITDSVDVREISGDTVLITAKLVNSKFLTGVSQAVLHCFQRVGLSTVTFVYRKSGLESNEAITGFTMLDEAVDVMSKQRGFSIHLLYDKAVWNMQLKALAARIVQFEKTENEEEKEKVLSSISQGRESFLPFGGIVTTEWVVPSGQSVELKRYFSNEFEDPMSLVKTYPKNEFRLRHQMLHRVISELPKKTQLEVHAHSDLHKRAYLKLGFFVDREDVNPLYPGAKIYVLTGSREIVLAKIELILNKNQ